MFFLVLHLIVRSCAVGAVLVALERVGSTSVARNPGAPGCFATVVLIASLLMLAQRAPQRYGDYAVFQALQEIILNLQQIQ